MNISLVSLIVKRRRALGMRDFRVLHMTQWMKGTTQTMTR